MGKVKIKVDWCDKNFAACPENENIACVVTHKTLEGLKKDMDEALRQHIEWMIEDGEDLPILQEIFAEKIREYDAFFVELQPISCFYAAEDYHQDYLDKNPTGYCHIPRSMFALAKNANRGND